MSNFELQNKDVNEWTETQFWESDPMQNNQSLCDIILWVQWEDKEATVETMMNTNSIPGELYHGLASVFNLPIDTDFSRFAKFYTEYIQPKLVELGNTFESEWNGSNWIGSLDRELEMKLNEFIRDKVPEHDYYHFFDLRDTFQNYSEIFDLLKDSGIDFLTADLDNNEVLDKVISYVDNGDVILINHDKEDYRYELKEMQEVLREKAEEDN